MKRILRIDLRVVMGLLFVALFASPLGAGEIPKRYVEKLKGTDLSFEMVLIPGGRFIMGSAKSETGRGDDEGPQHLVEIAPFYLCTTETTLELFMKYYRETMQPKRGATNSGQKKKGEPDAITGPTPVYGDLTMGWGMGGRPAIGMTWYNAITYCKWLSKKTAKKYRLPTEAEWEYACRAGTKTAYFFGDDPSKLGEYAWFEDNSDEKTQPVRHKKPNPWGLYDIIGNVQEWAFDYYSPDYYARDAKESPAKNPTGPKSGEVHCARGGGWDSSGDRLRSAARGYEEDWWRMYDPQWPKSKWWLPELAIIGVRVARSVEEKK